MERAYYLISDAAKKVEVETHVLRYWEEELELEIKRNDLGHRYYTKEDIDRFLMIKNLKEQGFQLRAIRGIIDESLEKGNATYEEMERPKQIAIINSRELNLKNEKSIRLQALLKDMFFEVLQENNKVLEKEIKESMLKELDYQFRLQEERADEREQIRIEKEDEHYRRLDERLREKLQEKDKRKKHSLF